MEPYSLLLGSVYDSSQMFLVVDKVIVTELKNKFDLLFTLLSSFYVFNICYPRGCNNFFSFLEIKVLAHNTKINSTVSLFISRI